MEYCVEMKIASQAGLIGQMYHQGIDIYDTAS
jgi:hypothetical protein